MENAQIRFVFDNKKQATATKTGLLQIEVRKKGKVKSVTLRTYEAESKFGEWEAGDPTYPHYKINFDANGLYQEYISYYIDGSLLGKEIPVYKNNKFVEAIWYDEEGQFEEKTKRNKTSKNETEVEVFNKQDEKIRSSKRTLRNGYVTKSSSTYFKDGKEDGIYTALFELDKDGNSISQKNLDEKGEVKFHATFEYLEFDQKGNWTKRLTTDADGDSEISIREIEYY